MRRGPKKAESDAAKPFFNLRRVWDITVNAVAATMTVYLILISIEPTRHFLEKYVGEIRIELIAAIVAIMFEIAIVTVSQLSRQVKAARLAVEARAPVAVIYDIGDVITDMRYRLKDRAARRKIDILGLTLDTTWPPLVPLLSADNLPGDCELNLYCLDPTFIIESKDLPDSWADISILMQRRIANFVSRECGRLSQHQIIINLTIYPCIPIVHGFRYGDGTLFISYLQWREDGIMQPFAFYECIAPEDTSQRATSYRRLFDDWMRRAAFLSNGPPVPNISATRSNSDRPHPDREHRQ